jgi:NRE family putative nickel resistance protein-like MFS transporter
MEIHASPGHEPPRTVQRPTHRPLRLYAAQTVSQIGDAFTWVALALLAFELARENAAVVLGTALTLRVTAFVLLSPLAGVLADRLERRAILMGTHFGRAVVIGLMPLVTEVWQLYGLMFALNALTAFFTPTNQATVPLVVGRDDAGNAFALSSATTELLGIIGPGLAGVLAALVGGRTLFVFDAASFVLAGLLILTLPSLKAAQGAGIQASTWRDIRDGTAQLWRDAPVRFALLMELVASIAGALILVVSVVRVQGGLNLGEAEYGWVMALYGLGATLASFVVVAAGQRVPRHHVYSRRRADHVPGRSARRYRVARAADGVVACRRRGTKLGQPAHRDAPR